MVDFLFTKMSLGLVIIGLKFNWSLQKLLWCHLLFLSESDLFYLLTVRTCSGYFCALSTSVTHSVGLMWTTERPVAEISTWKHTAFTRQTFMPSAVFEPAIPAKEWWQTHAIDRAAYAIGHFHIIQHKFHMAWHDLRAGIAESVCLPTVCQLQTLWLPNGRVQTLILLKLKPYVCRKLGHKSKHNTTKPLSVVRNPATVSCAFHLHNLRGTPDYAS